jgi:hypothetical protein
MRCSRSVGGSSAGRVRPQHGLVPRPSNRIQVQFLNVFGQRAVVQALSTRSGPTVVIRFWEDAHVDNVRAPRLRVLLGLLGADAIIKDEGKNEKGESYVVFRSFYDCVKTTKIRNKDYESEKYNGSNTTHMAPHIFIHVALYNVFNIHLFVLVKQKGRSLATS